MNSLSLNTTAKIFLYELNDVVRSRWMVGYGVFFLLVTDLLFRFGSGSAQVMLSLMNVVLILIPLVCVAFGTMHLYSAREFTELMLTQPVRRGALFSGLYLGLSIPLSAAFVVGTGIPFLLHGVEAASHFRTLAIMLVAGVFLTLIFTALAFLMAIRYDDRVRGLGLAILLWLFCSVVYDGIILGVIHAFADYPLERPVIALTLLNPVDLARVLLLLNFDISALMGYTGAVFEQFFGSAAGRLISLGALALWLSVPLATGKRLFERKDF